MELVALLRVLWRHRILVVVGGVVAIGMGLVLTKGPTTISGVASMRVRLDTPASELLEANPDGAETLGWRAQLLGDVMTTDAMRLRIAHDMGANANDVVLATPAQSVAPIPLSLPVAALDAAATSAASKPFQVDFVAASPLPIIRIDTRAPSRSAAVRLAAVAANELTIAARARRRPGGVPRPAASGCGRTRCRPGQVSGDRQWPAKGGGGRCSAHGLRSVVLSGGADRGTRARAPCGASGHAGPYGMTPLPHAPSSGPAAALGHGARPRPPQKDDVGQAVDSAVAVPAQPTSGAQPGRARVHWLDGMRGAAAMFVVLHHMWLSVWPGFPSDNGPWYLGGLLYGHLAVAVFIVVSGVSLALVPLSEGNRLRGGMRHFVRRRAWRILPAYWVALIFSTIVTALLLRADGAATGLGKGFVVHGLLLQDVIGSRSPNGAFWSIAVEWQIYFVFPVILWVARRRSLEAAVALTVGVVVIGHVLARLGGPFHKIDDLTPQFLALFALGILAVSLGRSDRRVNLARPLGAISLAIFVAFVVFAVAEGPEWMVAHYFYVDVVFGVGVACLVATILVGGAGWARRLLASRVGLRLGLFSYSVYLIHGPILAVLATYVIRPSGLSGVAEFALFLVVGLPLVLILSYGFHLLFEAPFLRYRDMRALRALPIARIRLPRPRRSVALPDVVVPVATNSSRVVERAQRHAHSMPLEGNLPFWARWLTNPAPSSSRAACAPASLDRSLLAGVPFHDDRARSEAGQPRVFEDGPFAALDVHLEKVDGRLVEEVYGGHGDGALIVARGPALREAARHEPHLSNPIGDRGVHDLPTVMTPGVGM